MKRYVTLLFILFALALISAWIAGATPVAVSNSKHNLSASGTGSIKASAAGATEICVFCHTPHGGNTNAPLWNRSMSVASYQTYTSDVLLQLNYWAAEDPQMGTPHVKTRICLACHDGTIALGNMINLPQGFSSDILLSGTTGANAMPSQAGGYIGTNLQDDHPVAIKHDTSKDNDLTSIPGASKVRLYDASALPTKNNLNYIECTSCHDAHDNQWGNFLIESNQNSALCYECHNKNGFTGSVHDDTTIAVSYAPPTGAPVAGGNPANSGPYVGNVKCINCHFPHKAGVTGLVTTNPPTANPNPGFGRYLLSFQEEKTCFNNPDRWGGSANACHGPAGGGKDIRTVIVNNSTSAHRVGSIGPYSGQHAATESRDQTGAGIYNWTNSGAKWHVECEDCHNPHTAGKTLHIPGGINGNAVPATGSPLSGTGGVSYSSYPAAWQSPTAVNYTYVEAKGLITNLGAGVAKEYEICLKCHSSFGWGATPPASPPGLTDQAKEFNPNNNAGYHPVVQNNTNTYASAAFKAGSGFSSTSLMYCSDCHGNNAASPSGPHGSSNASILKKVYGSAVVASTDTTFLCFDCHDGNTYGRNGTGAANTTGFSDGTQNLHTLHASAAFDQPCKACHAAIPHGYQSPTGRIVANRGLLLTEGTAEPAPYRGAVTTSGGGLGTANNMWLYVKTLKASGTWTQADCTWNVSTNSH